MEVNIHAAKTHFSKLIERVSMGEEIIIAKAGTPVAKLVGIHPRRKRRVLGQGKGLIKMKPGWDAPLTEEELAEFER